MNFSENTVLRVSALNEFAKRVLDGNSYLSSVNICGEISNFTNHYKSGHFYFTLKDEAAQIRCVMFASYASKLNFLPENGMKVTVHGRVSVFVRDGQYIFYADKMAPDGVGALYAKFEELKKKLSLEGLFSPEQKKPLPKFPGSVGIITSDTGAALQDILNIAWRRFPAAQIIVFPALVQGKGAEDDLCAGIRYFAEAGNADVIIIGRGGGSIEDLWAFNSEKLAREIYACPVPVVSAVGHETDFTICDFAADLRAPTPSAAAELVFPDKDELKRRLANVITKMASEIKIRLTAYRAVLERCAKSRFMQSPAYIIDEMRLYSERLSERLCASVGQCVKSQALHLRELSGSLVASQNNYTSHASAKLRELSALLVNYQKINTEIKKRKYAQLTAKLETLNPMSVISRGYCAVFREDGQLIKSVDDVDVGSEFNFSTTDGTITGKATSKRRNENA